MDNLEKNFGGFWTEKKIEIFIKYLRAYLQIMNNTKFKLIYFDGFAGSGYIETKNKSLIEGVALKVLSINEPTEFDIYYLVELDKIKSIELKEILTENFPDKRSKTFVVTEDCNKKLIDLCDFLKKNKNYRAIVFIDPKGMQLKWESIKIFENLGIDLWVLVPTGMGINRLLSKDGNKISSSFMAKLVDFLGMSEDEIIEYFYKEEKKYTLFGEESDLVKEKNAIDKSISLIKNRIGEIFKYVSNPFPMVNKKESLMYHFIFASNNKAGVKIANEIIGKELKESKK
ncbi:MAG: three-Cys-motif partner protein TcmP [Ignavibacteria bacterium]|nr:three-Cys-motif partner protein TcmP [Ignavibacteria bacterium]